MTFRKDCVTQFLALFEKHRAAIAASEGCVSLYMLQDTRNPQVIFTYSQWQDVSFLEKYRSGSVFAGVWPQTKALFELPAEAWTVKQCWP
ncbi:MAG: antibiotic biosynthesis monooxygenase [Flavobacteriales bacterium]|nr:antibiotic biosynthesis monooxygenase [Flavobacteriales bacterium]